MGQGRLWKHYFSWRANNLLQERYLFEFWESLNWGGCLSHLPPFSSFRPSFWLQIRQYFNIKRKYWFWLSMNMKKSLHLCFFTRNVLNAVNTLFGSSHSELFLRKGVLKIYSKFTGEHPCRSTISIKLLCKLLCFAFATFVLLKSHFCVGVLL